MLFSLFLIIDLYFLIPAIITQIFNLSAEFAIPVGIPGKEDTVNLKYLTNIFTSLKVY